MQAQGFSSKAERSAHSAETVVPPGQMLPAAQVVSLKQHFWATQVSPLADTTWPAGHATTHPAPKSASPSGHPCEHGARMTMVHRPAGNPLTSSFPGPRSSAFTKYCRSCPDARTDFLRLGISRAVPDTAAPPPDGVTVKEALGAAR